MKLPTVEEKFNGSNIFWKVIMKHLTDETIGFIKDDFTKDRQALTQNIHDWAEGECDVFEPADQVWFGDDDYIKGEYKLVKDKDGMYCFNCKRFTPEEGCICRLITLEDLQAHLKTLV